jgi:hypothetical protein
MSGPETVEVEVANTGSRDGRHVVQVYARAEGGEAPVLVGFAPVRVPAATTVTVSVPITLAPLQRWTEGRMVDPDEPVRLTVASYAGDPQALSI